MSIFDRISRIIKANLNDVLDKAEDPEKMLKQLLDEANENLMEVKTQTASAIAQLKQLEAKEREYQSEAEKWQAKAELAVTKGEDDLAREALARKKTAQGTADGFKAQVEAQHQSVEQLKASLGELESKIAEMNVKKDLLIARHRRAEAEQNIQKTMGKVGQSSALSAFERLERKVNDEEAHAAAYGELNHDSLDDKFKRLEAHSEVDDELAALKAKLGK